MASMPFSPCNDPTACTDESVIMLRSIFGDVIDALVLGLDPNSVAATSNLLATMFQFFNSGILIIGAIVVSYVAIVGTVNTANDGEAFGKNWSSVFTPLRIVAGAGVLLPSASGYSFIQIIVLMVALWGVGFANKVYEGGLALGILTPNGIVDGVNQPGQFYGLRDFAKQYLAASYCARAANAIYSAASATGQSPQVMAGNTHDNSVSVDGRTEYIFQIKDRNPATNLAGGDPLCGTIKIAQYTPQPMSDATSAALEQMRSNLQDQKAQAAVQMMADIDAWVNSWPTSINETGWDLIDSDQFNIIVKAAEDGLVASLAAQVSGGKGDVDASITAFVTAMQDGGWANGGGWLQRVGMIRGQIMNITTERVGETTEPSYSALPNDVRATLLTNSVKGQVAEVIKKSELKATYKSSGVVKPEDLASLVPNDPKADLNIGALKSDMDSKMSSLVNRTMLDVVEIATGANGTGVTPLCGTAGQMGGSISRMKCIGDYLTIAKTALTLADVTIKTAVTALRVVAGTLSSVSVVGTGANFDKVTDPIWDWVLEVPLKQLATLMSYVEPLAFYFSVFLPSLPYTIFMIVVVGWILQVLQSIIAAPLWAVMHMTPDRTFIGSQNQGYLLLMALFARPALAVLGLFAAIKVSDPIIDFIANGFFDMRGAVVSSTGAVGAISEFMTFAWWLILFGFTLLPVMYMCFTLPQVLPDSVLQWAGAGSGAGDLGATNAAGAMKAGGAGIGNVITQRGGNSNARIGTNGGNNLPPGGGNGNGGGGGGSSPTGGGGGAKRKSLSINGQGVTPGPAPSSSSGPSQSNTASATTASSTSQPPRTQAMSNSQQGVTSNTSGDYLTSFQQQAPAQYQYSRPTGNNRLAATAGVFLGSAVRGAIRGKPSLSQAIEDGSYAGAYGVQGFAAKERQEALSRVRYDGLTEQTPPPSGSKR